MSSFETTSGSILIERRFLWPSTVTVNGHKQVLAIKLDPEVVSKDDVEMLQDLIVAAIGDAHRKVDEALASQMQGLMGGLRIPGLS